MTTLIDTEIEDLCSGGNPMIAPFAQKSSKAPSWGLSSCGYDIRLGNRFISYRNIWSTSEGLHPSSICENDIQRRYKQTVLAPGEFLLAETLEHFIMPNNIYATVHDKSSWIRLGLSVHNTVIEPGWEGVLTLELKNINNSMIELRSGEGIAQVMFHRLKQRPRNLYSGKYQGQQGVTIPKS